MAKEKPVPLKKIKPSARRRTALARESASRVRKAALFTSATATVLQTESAGVLQPENELERTFKVRQEDILSQVDQSTAAKAAFELDLSDSGLTPYISATYSRSSRLMLLASSKGHVVVSNWRDASLQAELHLNETVRGATFLHNDAFFATAQRKYAYIYDSSGVEVHVLRNHREPGCIQFLPHHLLLATASAPVASHSKIVYTDTSTGETTAELEFGGKTLKLGNATDSSLNLSNGVYHLSHTNGIVSLWSPVVPRPLAQIFTHSGGVRNVSVSHNGRWMVTTGADCFVKVWDLRTYKLSASWKTPAQTTSLTTSQRGLIGLSFGARVQIWAPQSRGGSGSFVQAHQGWGVKPYMSQMYSGKRVTALDFCPFEDVLAVSHENGVATMIVPGAGEPNFDSRAPNPYETRKQRRESEVRTLLDKLPPATIALDPTFAGGIEQDPLARLREIREQARIANNNKRAAKADVKKAKGRNKISKRLRRKQTNIIDAKKLAMQEKLEQEQKTREAARKMKEKDRADVAAGIANGPVSSGPAIPDALNRFFPKK